MLGPCRMGAGERAEEGADIIHILMMNQQNWLLDEIEEDKRSRLFGLISQYRKLNICILPVTFSMSVRH